MSDSDIISIDHAVKAYKIERSKIYEWIADDELKLIRRTNGTKGIRVSDLALLKMEHYGGDDYPILQDARSERLDNLRWEGDVDYERDERKRRESEEHHRRIHNAIIERNRERFAERDKDMRKMDW